MASWYTRITYKKGTFFFSDKWYLPTWSLIMWHPYFLVMSTYFMTQPIQMCHPQIKQPHSKMKCLITVMTWNRHPVKYQEAIIPHYGWHSKVLSHNSGCVIFYNFAPHPQPFGSQKVHRSPRTSFQQIWATVAGGGQTLLHGSTFTAPRKACNTCCLFYFIYFYAAFSRAKSPLMAAYSYTFLPVLATCAAFLPS